MSALPMLNKADRIRSYLLLIYRGESCGYSQNLLLNAATKVTGNAYRNSKNEILRAIQDIGRYMGEMEKTNV